MPDLPAKRLRPLAAALVALLDLIVGENYLSLLAKGARASPLDRPVVVAAVFLSEHTVVIYRLELRFVTKLPL